MKLFIVASCWTIIDIAYENLDGLIRLRIGWPGVVKMVMDMGLQKNAEIFSTNGATVSFSRKVLLIVVTNDGLLFIKLRCLTLP